jgi:hypothetical protein
LFSPERDDGKYCRANRPEMLSRAYIGLVI